MDDKHAHALASLRPRDRARIDPPDRIETARYIAALTAEMSLMARKVQMPLLAYFLEMARIEAAEAASPNRRSGRAARERQPIDPDRDA
ncbi:MAG: hypothetical protein MEP57_07355 [Microvirga sp.]|nr:hypothetical protein [Microvirga sp.]